MAIHIKNTQEIAKMRTAGRLAAEVLEMISEQVKPGVTTNTLNSLCHEFITQTQQAYPSPLNYHGFPKSICTSVNHQICHGIPSDKKLKNGDIINIDITIDKEGFFGDTSQMFCIGKPSILASRLSQISRECLYIGIEMVKPGIHLGDIGYAIESHAKKHHFSVVQEYCGHGIGTNFHEEPQVLHYGSRGTGVVLEEGMTFTIEPMINAGKRHVKLLSDQWTVVTRDHSLSAQWEHTLLVTSTGVEILTLRKNEQNPLL